MLSELDNLLIEVADDQVTRKIRLVLVDLDMVIINMYIHQCTT